MTTTWGLQRSYHSHFTGNLSPKEESSSFQNKFQGLTSSQVRDSVLRWKSQGQGPLGQQPHPSPGAKPGALLTHAVPGASASPLPSAGGWGPGSLWGHAGRWPRLWGTTHGGWQRPAGDRASSPGCPRCTHQQWCGSEIDKWSWWKGPVGSRSWSHKTLPDPKPYQGSRIRTTHPTVDSHKA